MTGVKARSGAGMGMVSVSAKPASAGRALLWCNVAALALIVLSAFAVIQSTHACRELYSRLQVLETRQWSLQEDYGRLLLEESAWASHHRVERVARGELGMAEPDLQRYRLVAP